MQADTNIRTATLADQEAIFSLRKQLHVSAELSQTVFAKIFSGLLTEPNHYLLVLEADARSLTPQVTSTSRSTQGAL